MITKMITWAFSAVLFMAVGGVFVYSYLEHRGEAGEKHEAKEGEEEEKKVERVSRSETGEVVVIFDEGLRKRMGVECKPMQFAPRQPELTAYGVLQEEPSHVFNLRAPVPGFLRAKDGTPWPQVGGQLSARTVIGMIDPRLGPVERADLESRLAAAQAEVEEAKASMAAARASYDSKKTLNANNKMISDRAMEEAEAKLKAEQARLSGAEQTVRVFESSLTATSGPAGPLPLSVDRAGRIAQIQAQPGEAVESGQILVQISDYSSLLARIDLPMGAQVPPGDSAGQVFVAGHEDHPLRGERAGLASSAGVKTGGQSILLRVQAGDLPLQPGMPVTALLPLPGEPLNGAIIARAAVVRVAGKAWVYVQTEPDHFTRREIPLDHPMPDGWFVSKGIASGEQVVVQGAQSLLSEEFSFGTEEEEE